MPLKEYRDNTGNPYTLQYGPIAMDRVKDARRLPDYDPAPTYSPGTDPASQRSEGFLNHLSGNENRHSWQQMAAVQHMTRAANFEPCLVMRCNWTNIASGDLYFFPERGYWCQADGLTDPARIELTPENTL